MLRQRLPIGIALIFAFVGILWLDGLTTPWHPIWALLVTTAGVMASMELTPLLEKAIARPYGGLMSVCVGLCLAANAAAAPLGLHGLQAMTPTTLALGLSVCVLMLTGVKQFDDENPVLPWLAATLFGVVYIGLCGSFLGQLRYLSGPVAGAFALGLVVAVTKGTDIGAYTFGKLIGRRLMTPRLSPKKTWEGAFGGLLFGMLAAWLMTRLELAVRGEAWLGSLGTCVGFGLCVSVAGQLGDLAESMIKREAKVKDASGMIPGFGGILDLLDSLFLAAPAGWAILNALG